MYGQVTAWSRQTERHHLRRYEPALVSFENILNPLLDLPETILKWLPLFWNVSLTDGHM